MPPPLREGILYDCVELFRGSGNWSSAHEAHGFSVHDGFDNSGTRLFFRDLSDNSTFRTVIALALRGVVREFHAGPPCLTFGTLRRPRLRSIQQPAGFNMSDPLCSECLQSSAVAVELTSETTIPPPRRGIQGIDTGTKTYSKVSLCTGTQNTKRHQFMPRLLAKLESLSFG